MPRMRALLFMRPALLPMASLLAGCGLASGTIALFPAPNPAQSTMTNTPQQSLPAGLQSMWPKLLEDAAQRSGRPATALHASSVQAVIWPDGALGCPQPGRLYTQAMVPGWRVVIAVLGTPVPLLYHVSQGGVWLHCAAARASPALPPLPDSQT
jgi:hypothetical protein